MTCSCPLAQTGANCKHMAAVLCFWETEILGKIDEIKDESSNKATDGSNLTSEQGDINTHKDTQNETINEKQQIEKEDNNSVNIVNETNEVSSKKQEAPIILEHKNEEDWVTEKKYGQNDEPINENYKTEEQEKRNVTYSSNWQYRPTHHDEIIMKADVNTVFAFALYQNGTPLVKDVTIINNSDNEYKNLVIRVYSDYYFFDMNPINIGTLKPNEKTVIDGLSFQIHGNALKRLSEKITCNIFVCLTYGDEEWARFGSEINVLAINQWPGVDYDNVLLASFVMPNNPIVSNLLFYASEYLEKNTGDGALYGYQSGDPNRVLEMATAAYAAIQKKNIKYATAPSGFVYDGQKIRFADEMMALHMGNCMDMSLLYVSCLEQMGLNPLLVLMSGHIFSGVWLVDDIFSDSFTTDPSKVDKQIELGKIILVESTAMCSGQNIDFDDAMKSAKMKLSNYAEIEGVLDIRRARRGKQGVSIRLSLDDKNSLSQALVGAIYRYRNCKPYVNEAIRVKQIQAKSVDELIKRLYYYHHNQELSTFELSILFDASQRSIEKLLAKTGLNITKSESQKRAASKRDYGRVFTTQRHTRASSLVRNGFFGSKAENTVRTILATKLENRLADKYEIIVGLNTTTIIPPLEIDIPVILIEKSTEKIIKIAIEVDGEKYHQSSRMQSRDANKDYVVKEHGWHMVRVFIPLGMDMNSEDGEEINMSLEETAKSIQEYLDSIKETDSIEDSSDSVETKICPKCGGTLVKRVAKKGPYAGNEFWGCNNYPKCNYILNN